MNKYIAYEKLSKKEKRKIDSCQRRTWGNLNPITRKPQNSRAYNRKKNQYWKDELRSADSFFVVYIIHPVLRNSNKYKRSHLLYT